MATVWAIASGNVSVGANWNTGVVPGIDDDVYADGKEMIVDIANWSISSLRTTQRPGGTVSGTFTLPTSSYIATLLGFYTQTVNGGIIITANVNDDITLIGDYYNYYTANNSIGLVISGSSYLNIFGNLLLNKGAYAGYAFYFTGSGIVEHTGNLIGGSSSWGIGGYYNSVGLKHSGVGTYIHTGKLTALATEAVSVAGTGVFISTGIAIPSSSHPAIYSTGAGNIFYNGILKMETPPTNTIPVIYQGTTGAGCVYFKGIAVNNSNTNAIFAIRMCLLSTGSTTWKFKNELGVDKNLYTADSSPLGNPAISDVRKSVVFGPSGELAGTLAVPPPESVTKGVPTDNTVGTCEVMNATDFLAELANSSDPLAVRLRNVATAQSTGDQLAELE